MSTDHNSNIVGKVLYEYPALPSTNQEALNLINAGKAEEGVVISTDEQTDGRGQLGTAWLSDAGKNLTLSVIFKPAFLPVQDQFYLSKAVSLAVHSLVQELIPAKQIFIKWPNDIWVEDRKIAGILIQTIIQGHALLWAVCGVGLNINQLKFDKTLTNATSVVLETGEKFALIDLRQRLFHRLQHYYDIVLTRKTGLDHLYEQVLYRKGIESQFMTAGGKKLTGTIIGVSPAGQLLLEEPHGTRHSFAIKEISFV